MDNLTDQQLLRDYSRGKSEAAFAELVRRHIDLVYSAALRMVCDAHLADDVVQGVFVALAQNAPRLTDRLVLSGWLHRTSQHLASKVVRTDIRRRAREQEAAVMNELLSAEPDSSWEEIAPALDAALGELSDTERDALLLRYFERKSARQMAQILGVSDEAAQKRVSRALEHVRQFFSRRGVPVGASGLAAILSANAVQSAPLGLLTAISSGAALSGGALATTTLGLAKTLAMTTFQKILITTAIAAAMGIGIHQTLRASRLQAQALGVQQQQDWLSAQNRQLENERDAATNELAAAQQEISRLRNIPGELLKLRGEVTRLRGDSQAWARFKEAEAGDPTGATARSWLTRVDQLKQAVQNMPDKKIPELQLLTERNWLDAVKDAKPLQTEADVRQALNNLRDSAKMTFGEIAKDALAKYAEANGGQLPGQWSQLKPYFETPVDDAVLQRWQLLKTGNLGQAQNDNLFAETAPPVDPQYDSFYEFSMNGLTSYDLSKPSNVVELATAQFAEAHNGLLPNDASQLTPYLKRPMAPADIQTVLNQIPAGTKTLHELNAVGGR